MDFIRVADISDKPVTARVAVAEGIIRLKSETVRRILRNEIEKGNVIAVSSLAAILAVKKTHELIPLAHNIPVEWVNVEHEIVDSERIRVRVTVKTTAKTGVEMESLVGVAVALLAIWDMVKKYEKNEQGLYPHTLIEEIRVLEKRKEVLKGLEGHR